MAIIAAMEHIDRQTDDFPQRLESAIELLLEEIEKKQLVGKNIDGTPLVKSIEKIIYDRLKIRVTIYTNRSLAAILPYYSNQNHIFLREWFRGQTGLIDQQRLLKQQINRKGTVNIHKATVSGIFSEYNHPLYMNFGQLVNFLGTNAGEIAAILLHELGHAFNACYYADRTDATNQVLASIGQRLMDRRGEGDLEYIHRELSTVTPSIKKEEVDTMLNGSRTVAGLIWFKTMVGVVRNQMKNDRYNDTAYEELSDSFAGRFGQARNLASALEKLSQFNIEKSPAAMKLTYLLEFMKITGYIVLVGALFMNPASLTAAVASSVLAVFFTYVAGEDFEDYTYDKLKDRYIRIRQDTVDQLKERDLPANVIKEMLEAIYDLDEIIKNTAEHRGLLNRLSNLIFSNNREALASIEAQKLLESLASNDLFVASAKLQTKKD